LWEILKISGKYRKCKYCKYFRVDQVMFILQEKSPKGELQRILRCQGRLHTALDEVVQAAEVSQNYNLEEGTSRSPTPPISWMAKFALTPTHISISAQVMPDI
jgi:hypothetical protein